MYLLYKTFHLNEIRLILSPRFIFPGNVKVRDALPREATCLLYCCYCTDPESQLAQDVGMAHQLCQGRCGCQAFNCLVRPKHFRLLVKAMKKFMVIIQTIGPNDEVWLQ